MGYHGLQAIKARGDVSVAVGIVGTVFGGIATLASLTMGSGDLLYNLETVNPSLFCMLPLSLILDVVGIGLLIDGLRDSYEATAELERRGYPQR